MLESKIYNGDCLEVMNEIANCTFDAIVTDPPYGLGFMGKAWDNDVPGAPYWDQALRVAKPGAHLLCFGGTRKFHRMACAIEDAGWEIRDCIMWVYGSGFPKSMDVAKAIDKASGYVGEVIGTRTVDVGMQGGNMHAGRKQQQQQQVHTLSEQAQIWQGWGTALKPAWEPIIVARKPLDGTIANNVLEHGTGALNIDGCRVPIENEKLSYGTFHAGGENGLNGTSTFRIRERHYPAGYQPPGRFPANLIHDGSDEILELFPETKPARKSKLRSGKGGYTYYKNGKTVGTEHNDNGGSAARFFYCAKASKSDRGKDNDHPTVKPNDLMRWLVRLVCHDGGVVLDPFMGSGSTGVACFDEGVNFVGIELNEHYAEIAESRLCERGFKRRGEHG